MLFVHITIFFFICLPFTLFPATNLSAVSAALLVNVTSSQETSQKCTLSLIVHKSGLGFARFVHSAVCFLRHGEGYIFDGLEDIFKARPTFTTRCELEEGSGGTAGIPLGEYIGQYRY